MRVAVTGATGNVGTSVLAALAEEAEVESVVGIARRRPAVSVPKVEWREADVTRDDLVPLFGGADVVVHLAWVVQPNHDQAALQRVNVDGSLRVFEAVAAAGVRTLVSASAFGAYSAGPKHRAADESWPTHARRELDWSPAHSGAAALVEFLEGVADGAGGETPPLLPLALARPSFRP